jgi:hypothetical protein
LPAVRRAVVDDQEHASGVAVGLDGHELLDQRVERDDPVLRRAAIKQPRAADVSRGQIAQRALALVLVLDQLPVAARCGRLAGMLARAGAWIDGFSSAHTTNSPGSSRSPSQRTLIQIQDPAGLLRKARVAREDPRAVVPQTDRVLAQPAPDRDRRDRRDNPRV